MAPVEHPEPKPGMLGDLGDRGARVGHEAVSPAAVDPGVGSGDEASEQCAVLVEMPACRLQPFGQQVGTGVAEDRLSKCEVEALVRSEPARVAGDLEPRPLDL